MSGWTMRSVFQWSDCMLGLPACGCLAEGPEPALPAPTWRHPSAMVFPSPSPTCRHHQAAGTAAAQPVLQRPAVHHLPRGAVPHGGGYTVPLRVPLVPWCRCRGLQCSQNCRQCEKARVACPPVVQGFRSAREAQRAKSGPAPQVGSSRLGGWAVLCKMSTNKESARPPGLIQEATAMIWHSATHPCRPAPKRSARCPLAEATAAGAAGAAVRSSSGSTTGSVAAPMRGRQPWRRPTARRLRRCVGAGAGQLRLGLLLHCLAGLPSLQL